jgi:DNA primase
VGFPEGFVEDVRRAADIVRVISDHVALRKLGTSWKGLCPFHHEKTPSFNVRSEPAVFHCFGCGEGGDVFKFVMLHERASFPEAVESLARRFGVPIPEGRFDPGPDRKEREDLLELLEAAAQHFTRHLWSPAGTRAREYLLGRGFAKQTLERIRAGAALESWSDLLDAMRRRFPENLLALAGLVVQKPETGRAYDRFRNRAVFPILNESGKVVGFGARSLDGSEPKYLNSPESPVYNKSRTLYGLSWARDSIRREGRAVLMEGYLDVARAIEGGVGEAVATCGTALTGGHARLLRRFAQAVCVNFDQDEAGQRAARKSLDLLLEEGLEVRVVELPEGHDPDSFLKASGAEAYSERLKQAPAYMEWLIRRAAADCDTRTPAGKAAYLNALLPSLARLENAVERAAWVPTIVARGGLDERAAHEEVRRAVAARLREVPVKEAAPRAATTAASLLPAERLLLSLLLREAEGVPEALQQLEQRDLEALRSAPLLGAARSLLSAGRRLSAAALEAELEADDARRMLREVAVDGSQAEGVEPLACVRELKRLPLKARMAEIQKDLRVAEGKALEALLEEKNRLGRLMASL